MQDVWSRKLWESEVGVHEISKLALNDYVPFERMVAAGGYTWVDKRITKESFPILGGSGSLFEAVLFSFPPIRSAPIIDALKERGLVTASIAHLLAYGEQHPKEPLGYPWYPICALGSVGRVKGFSNDNLYSYIPQIARGGEERHLRLSPYGQVWNAGTKFLAIRLLKA